MKQIPIDEIGRPDINNGKPLNVREAACYLDVSQSYLYKLTSRRLIPHFKPAGKRIYFLKTDLRDYLLQHRIDPANNPATGLAASL